MKWLAQGQTSDRGEAWIGTPAQPPAGSLQVDLDDTRSEDG